MIPANDDVDQARIRRQLCEAYDLLKKLEAVSNQAGVECKDLFRDWFDRLTEQWVHQ